ncbi:MAG: branched-chain amino acid ABC transporter permease, partial [Anaerolineae bacterium]|nr:branched-chain amino acid ABC transporter permease [Anaerolineae bacterium]
MDQFLQAVINGILLGGFYAAMVLGFSIIWGVMGVINLAHGEIILIGAYLTWILSEPPDYIMGQIQIESLTPVFIFLTESGYQGMDPFFALIIILPLMFGMGYILQKFLINRVVERPHLVSLLVTFGLAIVLANIAKLLFTASPRSVDVSYSGALRFGDLTFSNIKTLVFIGALVMLIGLQLFLSRTRMGKSIRAAAQNKNAARMVGIEISRVYAITAGICIALTAAAGMLISPTQAIFPFMGPPLTLRAFTITALGGLGSIPGALLGGLLLGITETLIATFVPRVGTNLAIV